MNVSSGTGWSTFPQLLLIKIFLLLVYYLFDSINHFLLEHCCLPCRGVIILLLSGKLVFYFLFVIIFTSLIFNKHKTFLWVTSCDSQSCLLLSWSYLVLVECKTVLSANKYWQKISRPHIELFTFYNYNLRATNHY